MSLAHVQSVSANNNGSSSSLAAPSANMTTGNLVVVAVRSSAGVSATVTDTAGNTYTQIDTLNAPSTGSPLTLFYAKNITGHASNVVTANFSGSIGYRGITVSEFSGADTTSPLDVSAKGSSASSPVTSGAFTTTVADAVLIAGVTPEAIGLSYTPDTGYTIPSGATSNYIVSEYKIVSAIQSSVTASMSVTGTPPGIAIIVAAFKAAGGGGPVIPVFMNQYRQRVA